MEGLAEREGHKMKEFALAHPYLTVIGFALVWMLVGEVLIQLAQALERWSRD